MKTTIAKAFILSAIGFFGFVGMLAPVVNAASASPYMGGGTATTTSDGTTIQLPGDQTFKGDDSLITTIKRAVNILLSFLGLIALIILLVGGFQMVTAAGDENKYKKGFTILRQAAIGLLFIWLAALFVNLIFWFIQMVS